MGDEKRLEDGRQEAGLDPYDTSLSDSIDNATSEELDETLPEDGTATGPAAQEPEIEHAREQGTTAPKLS
jgi:hypothetical protein